MCLLSACNTPDTGDKVFLHTHKNLQVHHICLELYVTLFGHQSGRGVQTQSLCKPPHLVPRGHSLPTITLLSLLFLRRPDPSAWEEDVGLIHGLSPMSFPFPHTCSSGHAPSPSSVACAAPGRHGPYKMPFMISASQTSLWLKCH